MPYLQDLQYYEDRYDLATIKECLDYYTALKQGIEKKRDEFKMPKEEFDHEVLKATSYALNIIKIQRFRSRADTIRAWMEKDRAVQERYDQTPAPTGIYCTACFSKTTVTFKELLDVYTDTQHMLFMFACVKCHKKQAILEDGTTWQYEPPKCPTCQKTLTVTSIDTAKKSINQYTCSCGYSKEDIYDFVKMRQKRLKEEAQDKKLLETYKQEFCYSEEEGPKAVQNLDAIVRFMTEHEAQQKKQQDPLYQKAQQLRILKIGPLKELLETVLAKEGFIDLAFAKPDMGKHVIIDFSVNDAKEEREENKSCNQVRQIITKALEQTNWRLMSEGISYRLGILTGRLKAYEQESDLMALVTAKEFS